MSALIDWVDDRTGIRGAMRAVLYEAIPGGARWRYVWGSTLVLAFLSQLTTGIFLWMFYSPSAQTAWESVFQIQYEIGGGWLLRGLHHYMAQAMVVLLVLHLLQVVFAGAYRAPREFNFWIGLLLMFVVLAFSLTGYLLPWDQKGYWATQVATKLASLVPGIGHGLQRLIVGGPEYGHYTLTRFFALHAGVLPGSLVILLAMHLALFRRHGIHVARVGHRATAAFWPGQVLRDGAAFLGVLAVVLGLVLWPALAGDHQGQPPGEYLGADLAAPADAANPYAAARPEWYFLFLFQFLTYFDGPQEVVGAVYIPAAVVGVLLLMPILGRRRLGHGFNVAFVSLLIVAAVGLTGVALYHDRTNADYLAAVEHAERNAERAKQLSRAPDGIPAAGAISLLRSDPMTVGPQLFERYCLKCHRYDDAAGPVIAAQDDPTASNLYRFASREWIAGVLDPERITGPDYFGGTAHADGDMVGFVTDTFADLDAEGQARREKVIVALSAQAQLPDQRAIDHRDADAVAVGTELIARDMGCTDCHRFGERGELGTAPELTGYGSRAWMVGMIRDPRHARYYGDNNDRMPSFAPEGDGESSVLGIEDIERLADWIRGDWYRPDEQAGGGEPTAAPPQLAAEDDAETAGGADAAAVAGPDR